LFAVDADLSEITIFLSEENTLAGEQIQLNISVTGNFRNLTCYDALFTLFLLQKKYCCIEKIK
ncbi:hypothetical protein ACJX0J_022135, partial [Zea mays]